MLVPTPPMPPLRLTINGELREIEIAPPPTVAALLRALKSDGTPCAVEVNRAIVPHTARERTALRDGDTVEIVTFVGGG